MSHPRVCGCKVVYLKSHNANADLCLLLRKWLFQKVHFIFIEHAFFIKDMSIRNMRLAENEASMRLRNMKHETHKKLSKNYETFEEHWQAEFQTVT